LNTRCETAMEPLGERLHQPSSDIGKSVTRYV
jgi:hypothetical protein